MRKSYQSLLTIEIGNAGFDCDLKLHNFYVSSQKYPFIVVRVTFIRCLCLDISSLA